MKYARSLVSNLSAFAGKPVNATEWIAFFGFDVMGDLAFGKSFNMLESGEMHFALKLMLEGLAGLGYLGALPWAFPILIRIPGLMKNFTKWVTWSEKQILERQKVRRF
jgi:cytochrome P450 family 628